MSQEIQCPACGAAFGSSPRCGYCHEGLRYAGRPFRFTPSERHCPRCGPEAALLTIGFDGVQIDVCEACEGAWFDVGELGHIVGGIRTAVKSGQWAPERALESAAPAGTSPLQQGYIPCPTCGKLMNRVNWEKKSGVVVDMCRSHGIWLDGGEIAALQGWAARTPDGPPKLAAELEPPKPVPEVRSVLSMPVRRRGSPVEGVLDLLFNLFT